jgi:hypothetical protein
MSSLGRLSLQHLLLHLAYVRMLDVDGVVRLTLSWMTTFVSAALVAMMEVVWVE